MASAGAHVTREIAEQPKILTNLVRERAALVEVAQQISARQPRFVLLNARGSSDHAALYAKYLIEILLGLPVGLVSPSTVTLYQAKPDLRDVLLISVSQGGGSPDLLAVAESARERGALTLTVTNTASSPLAAAAELALDIRAGVEQGLAATKSYTATLLTLYLLVDAIRGGDGAAAANIGELAERTLAESEPDVQRAVDRYRFAHRIITTGRGYSFATALEAALKLAETSYLTTRAYSGADLLHGPVAAVDAETAVLAVTSHGQGGTAMHEVLRAVAERRGDVLAIGSAAADTTSSLQILVPRVAEELAPILEILPIQRLALGLALSRGADPDNPRGLRKIVETL